MAKIKSNIYHVDASPRVKIEVVQPKMEISDSEAKKVSEIDALFLQTKNKYYSINERVERVQKRTLTDLLFARSFQRTINCGLPEKTGGKREEKAEKITVKIKQRRG